MFRRYMLYLVRWQLSTPLLAVCITSFARFGNLVSTIIANLVGGLIFFWVDRFIFGSSLNNPVWEIRSSATCYDCGKVSRGYRLVSTRNYDRRFDPDPEYRCEECSIKKAQSMSMKGLVLE